MIVDALIMLICFVGAVIITNKWLDKLDGKE